MEGQKEYLAAIAAFPKINGITWRKIIAYFPSLKDAWEARTSELAEAGVKDKILEAFLDYRSRINPGEVFDRLNKLGIHLVSLMEEDYPKNLKEIYNPPFVLYVRGKLTKEDELSIAVIGSRRATDYGKRATYDISEGVAKAGVTIISGLALGLDAIAHEAALKVNGRTIAVLANGLDQIRPMTNFNLGKRILESGGAIISEQPVGMPSYKQNFPARNRIISGLSCGVLVTEAGEKSGTLHTANFAIEQNRQVYAVPGPIYNPNSAGPNMLIKMGAKPVSTAVDILEDFGIENERKRPIPENDNERLIFKILENEAKQIDTITKECQKEAAEVSQILTMMEIKGKVKHLGGMVYTIR